MNWLVWLLTAQYLVCFMILYRAERVWWIRNRIYMDRASIIVWSAFVAIFGIPVVLLMYFVGHRKKNWLNTDEEEE